MRATLIVNPYATSVTEELVRRVEGELAAAYELETVLTERRGHATELARSAEPETIFAFGGDGLYNEVLNGVEGDRVLGFVPGGGTSVLPRALGLPRNPVEAARRLTTALQRRISLGRVNGRRFGFGAGIGLDSEVVRQSRCDGAEGRRPPPGRPRLRPGCRRHRRGERLATRADVLVVNGTERAALVVVSNDAVFTFAGGTALRFSPEARFEQGLDYAAVSGAGVLRILRGLGRVARGRGLAGLPGVTTGHDLDRIEVVCDRPRPLQADGEDLGDVERAVFECERDAVSVLA